MIQLFDKQQVVVTELRQAMHRFKSVLLYGACGFGKTVVGAYIFLSAVQKGKRVIFAVHRNELIRQTAATFDKFGIHYSYIAAGYPCNSMAKVFIASIPTLVRRLGKFPADLLWVDESHLSMSNTWHSVVNWYRTAGAYIIGCTASPCRLDGKGLRGNFEYMVLGPGPRELMEAGRLARYRLFIPAQPDTSGLHTLGGDFRVDESEELMDTPAITGDAIAEWMKHAKGMLTIVYCTSIAHSKNVAQAFREAGVSAFHIDGDTHDDVRIGALRDFADGKIQVITNCSLFTEGVDIAALAGRDDVRIKCVIALLVTQSLARWIQICGRAWRRDSEYSIILDLGGISLTLGLPDEPREWSLDGEVKKEKKKATSVKVCPKCFAGLRSEIRKCPECGHLFAVKSRVLERRDGELVEVTPEELAKRREKRALAFEQSQATTPEALAEVFRKRGYKGNLLGRAKHVLAARAAKSLKLTPSD